MKTGNYWQDRIQEQQTKLWSMGANKLSNRLQHNYKVAYDQTMREMSELWDKLQAESADGKVRPNDLYKMNRYYEIQNHIADRLIQLGEYEKSLYAEQLMAHYKAVFGMLDEYISVVTNQEALGVFTLEQKYAAEEVINSVWCADGKHWSDRSWTNKDKLRTRLEKGLMDCVSRGVSKDEMIKTLAYEFGTGFNDADRIARTELTYVQNQACKQRYEEAGIEKYKFLAEIDGRTSDICKGLNGKVFLFKDAQVGINYPPAHVRCRSTVVPVIE